VPGAIETIHIDTVPRSTRTSGCGFRVGQATSIGVGGSIHIGDRVVADAE
jgi:hypothetical protein